MTSLIMIHPLALLSMALPLGERGLQQPLSLSLQKRHHKLLKSKLQLSSRQLTRPLNKINLTMTVVMLISIYQSTTPLQRQHRLQPKPHVTVGSTSHKPQNWSNTKVLYIRQRDTVALSVGSPTGTIGDLETFQDSAPSNLYQYVSSGWMQIRSTEGCIWK